MQRHTEHSWIKRAYKTYWLKSKHTPFSFLYWGTSHAYPMYTMPQHQPALKMAQQPSDHSMAQLTCDHRCSLSHCPNAHSPWYHLLYEPLCILVTLRFNSVNTLFKWVFQSPSKSVALMVADLIDYLVACHHAYPFSIRMPLTHSRIASMTVLTSSIKTLSSAGSGKVLISAPVRSTFSRGVGKINESSSAIRSVRDNGSQWSEW